LKRLNGHYDTLDTVNSFLKSIYKGKPIEKKHSSQVEWNKWLEKMLSIDGIQEFEA
jgi:hypothetical protein